jgi:glutamate racemase
VVLGCNTAAAVALRRLQQTWLSEAYPERRVLGVLVPMVEAITGVPWMAEIPASRHAGQSRRVAVFATRQTVASQAYPREIAKRAPEVTVVQQACPHLAALIEAGAPRADIAALVRGSVEALMMQLKQRPPDAVMLGCTHYPLVADLFAQCLPPGVALLSQPELVARSLTAYLHRHPHFVDRGTEPVHFLTTGDAETVSRLASRFCGKRIVFTAAPPPPPSPRR